ncbi:hypothetical protein QYE76_061078 [Lolium multiflorum]|uniref:Uncharacterized protein n=1 Tax=Lolium multiflorum TaxID=4521 RepID=A0AAD8S1L9_LOLMU|nr:hypothetical protein QYE76_061078 [Lolium multiflorum]
MPPTTIPRAGQSQIRFDEDGSRRGLRLRARASAASAKSTETSRRALLGLTEPELRQLAVDLGQQGYREKQLHDLVYKNRAKQIKEFADEESAAPVDEVSAATAVAVAGEQEGASGRSRSSVSRTSIRSPLLSSQRAAPRWEEAVRG